MANCNPSSATRKPRKLHPDFPLFAHAADVWAKKVRQRLHYFGPWTDPEGALNRWLEQKDALLAGRTPYPKTEGFALRDLANRFLTAKKHLADTGEKGKPNHYRILDGHRRVRAFEVLGADDITVMIRWDLADADEAKIEAEFLQHNFNRRHLHQIDRARIALRLF